MAFGNSIPAFDAIHKYEAPMPLYKYKSFSDNSFNTDLQEYNYLELLENVLKNGERRQTRNSETLSMFGTNLSFDISKYFPLITTKKVYWKGVVEELLWFIRAQTDASILKNKGFSIYTSKE